MGNTPYFTKLSTDRPWYVVDASGQVLGRLAAAVAKLIIGKHRPQFQPGQDCGGFVVVLNADKVAVTGTKMQSKMYYRHSGYPGGLKTRTLQEFMKMDSAEVVRHAVKGMLPKNKLGNRLITKLKVYKGSEHPHKAQLPQAIDIEQLSRL